MKKFAVCLLIFCTGCAARPMLYPNTHLEAVGKDHSKRDIAECRSLADDYVAARKAAKVAAGTAEGGAVGGAAGAAGGAVLGHPGLGAATGAAAGAAGGLVRGIFRSKGPSRTYKNFVDHCLRDRGYEVIGWE